MSITPAQERQQLNFNERQSLVDNNMPKGLRIQPPDGCFCVFFVCSSGDFDTLHMLIKNSTVAPLLRFNLNGNLLALSGKVPGAY
jgi:hypothetical protein